MRPKAQRFRTIEELRAATIAEARRRRPEWKTVSPLPRTASRRSSDPEEIRAAKLLRALDSSISRLEMFVTSTRGRGPLATWARKYGKRVLSDVRDMRLPLRPPPKGPTTKVAQILEMVSWLNPNLDYTDLAIIAIACGWYFPELPGSKPENLTVAQVIQRGRAAFRNVHQQRVIDPEA